MQEPSPSASVLLYDKPAGVTSHDIVAAVRRDRGGKVGHAGTLDPFATGLLVILLGRATRLQRYLLGLPKTYLATALLGWRSTTGDPDGELTETGRIPDSPELPTGSVRQRLPMTSAARVGGERLYKKAHRGETVETPERDVEIHRADLLERDDARARFEIECSSGTYIRTLVETLEDAYCEELRRTAVGDLRIEDAGRELEPLEALGFLPTFRVRSADADAMRHGRRVGLPADGEPIPPGPIAVTFRGKLLAVARAEDGRLVSEMVLS